MRLWHLTGKELRGNLLTRGYGVGVLRSGADGVVPFGMEGVSGEGHGGKLGGGDLDAGRVVAVVAFGVDFEAGACGRAGDEFHDGREMSHGDDQAGTCRERAEAGLERPDPVPVRSTRVSSDQQTFGLWVSGSTDLVPPSPDRSYRELGGVVVVADHHEPFIGGHVVHPIRDGLAHLGIREVVHVRPHR